MRLVPLSVCIITLNERDNLPRCLESVAGLAAQIVVVDSGSTDGTRQIARAAGAELHERPFEGMHQQKQFALELAREEWVLSLDADEWLDGRLREEVAAVVNGGGGGGAQATQGASTATVAAYALNRRNEYLGAWIDHCGWSPQWRLRLARRARVRFTGHGPHDEMVADGAVGRLTGRLCHRPYRDLADHVAKINRYTDTSARERHAAGERAGLGQLVLRPPARFLRMYVLRAGFLDGRHGFMLAVSNAEGTYYRYLKLMRLGEKR